MADTEIVSAKPQPEDDEVTLLYATDPAGVAASMHSMLAWVERKIGLACAEVADHKKVLEITTGVKWGVLQAKKLLAAAKARLVFYQKIHAALNAGYMVVPNLPMRNIIIRTRGPVRGADARQHWGNTFEQAPRLLPQGEGELRNPMPVVEQYSRTEKNPRTGAEEKETWQYPEDWRDEIVFPAEIAKPAIIERLTEAAALKLFDEIRLVEDTPRPRRRRYSRGDPVVIGRLLNPRAHRPDVSFFIGWVTRLDQI